MSIAKRGYPKEGDPVHLRVLEEWREDHPACNSGNFHVFWSRFVEDVTCIKCKAYIAKLEKEHDKV
jgi:hypothetical protein